MMQRDEVLPFLRTDNTINMVIFSRLLVNDEHFLSSMTSRTLGSSAILPKPYVRTNAYEFIVHPIASCV